VCAETGKNAGVPGTPQRHLGNSALGIPGPLYFTRRVAHPVMVRPQHVS
jgi:hypothetical protein